MNHLEIILADYANPVHGEAVRSLLNTYACDPMGGSEALAKEVLDDLVPGLAATPNAFSILAFRDGAPVGLANCFRTFSTFVARPLINIHDVIVMPQARGTGVGRALFAEIERIARDNGACKVTLEVLEGNMPARALYTDLGYGDYVLDPELGPAMFWQKRLAA